MAAKVFDGFFLGDSETSMDAEFLDLNKISRLVNVASQEISNVWSGHGFVYDNYNWEDQPEYLVFPAMEKDRALQNLVEFIDVSLKKGESVLVFSLRGTSRSVFAACAYLMYKYNWGFEKSYDFLLSKKSDIHINQGFVQQLFCLERKLYARRQLIDPVLLQVDTDLVKKEILRRREWDSVYLNIPENNPEEAARRAKRIALTTVRVTQPGELDDDNEGDELLLINSFLNSKNTLTVLPGPYMDAYNVAKNFKLRFNSVVQEEDIHMFPTNPCAPNMKAKFGILKRRKRPQSMMIKRGADSTKGAPSDSKRVASVPSAITFIPGINGTTPVSIDSSTSGRSKEKSPSPTKSKKSSSKKDPLSPSKKDPSSPSKKEHSSPSKKEHSKDSTSPRDGQAMSPRKPKKSSKRDKDSPSKNRDSARENKRDSVSRSRENRESRESRHKESGSRSSNGTESSRSRHASGPVTDSSSTKSSPRATTSSLTSANAEGKDSEYGGNSRGLTKSEEDAVKSLNAEQRTRYLKQGGDVIGPGGSPRGDDKYDLKGRLGFAENTTNTIKTTISNKTIVCKGSDKSFPQICYDHRSAAVLSTLGGRSKRQSKEIKSSSMPVITSEEHSVGESKEHSVGRSGEGSAEKNTTDKVKTKFKSKSESKSKSTTVKEVEAVVKSATVANTREVSPAIIPASHKKHTPSSNLSTKDIMIIKINNENINTINSTNTSTNTSISSNSSSDNTVTTPVKESMCMKSSNAFARVLKSMTHMYSLSLHNSCHYSGNNKRTLSVRGTRNQ
jgi:protein-tyrosine phosphatase